MRLTMKINRKIKRELKYRETEQNKDKEHTTSKTNSKQAIE